LSNKNVNIKTSWQKKNILLFSSVLLLFLLREEVEDEEVKEVKEETDDEFCRPKPSTRLIRFFALLATEKLVVLVLLFNKDSSVSLKLSLILLVVSTKSFLFISVVSLAFFQSIQ